MKAVEILIMEEMMWIGRDWKRRVDQDRPAC